MKFSPDFSMHFLRVLTLGYNRQAIPNVKLPNLSQYKYKGVDYSLTSKYLLQPFWSWLVTLFPFPNLITLMGLILMASSLVVCLYLSPSLTVELSSWVYILVAISMFSYQSLDAIDGKQARRTGMSGPLGQLFDHGCDSINLVITTFIMASLLRNPPSLTLTFTFLIGILSFYCATWEEYQTGILFLGYISGPVEGQLMLITLTLLLAWDPSVVLSNSISSTFGFGHTKNNSFFLYLTCIFGILTVLASLYNVYKHHNSLSVFKQLLPFSTFLCIVFSTVYYSPDLLSLPNYLFYMATVSFTFTYSVNRVIISHITKDRLFFWNPGFLSIIATGIIVMFRNLGVFSIRPENFTRYLICSACYSGITYIGFAKRAVDQICHYLKIECFRVKDDKEQ